MKVLCVEKIYHLTKGKIYEVRKIYNLPSLGTIYSVDVEQPSTYYSELYLIPLSKIRKEKLKKLNEKR
jgi:hypothetical protein